MRILLLSLYFEPDLCAGSFRNSNLFKELIVKKQEGDFIHVITQKPNRYSSFSPDCLQQESGSGYLIDRVSLLSKQSGFMGQLLNFARYYQQVLKLSGSQEYDLVYASSSRLLTAFLGKWIACRKKAKLYLDIRDIFVDTMNDVFAKKRLLRLVILPILVRIEKFTFTNAEHINLVSEGFKEYFSKYTNSNFTYFTNGIDECFLQHKSPQNVMRQVKVITYAGNIGEGQGLEKILPMLGQILGSGYKIQVIGEGGAKNLLIDTLQDLHVENVELISPVSREKLLDYYDNSDFLFLHLNDYKAFEKVLPSKIFEYSVYDLPIIAGVSGYAAEFIATIPVTFIAQPGDFEAIASYILNYRPMKIDRTEFVEKYSRKNIMRKMANNILEY